MMNDNYETIIHINELKEYVYNKLNSDYKKIITSDADYLAKNLNSVYLGALFYIKNALENKLKFPVAVQMPNKEIKTFENSEKLMLNIFETADDDIGNIIDKIENMVLNKEYKNNTRSIDYGL